MATPHDRLAKAVFSDPAQAAVVFRAVLPPALLRQLDLSAAELQDSLFTDDALKERRADLVFRVPLRDGGEVYLLTLLEHQSSVDLVMPARMHVYAGRAIDRILQRHRAPSVIPAVIPVVIYHGAAPWNAPTTLTDLYQLPEEARAALEGIVPSLRLLIDDLSQVADEELRQRPGPVLARCALIVMRHAQDLLTARDPARVLRSLAQSLGDLLQRVRERTGRTVIFRYILEITEVELAEGERILVEAMPDPVKEDVVTLADQLRAQGHQEGRLEGKRGVVLRLLHKRFGSLTPAQEQRVAHGADDQLEVWVDRLLSAANLDEVFAE